MFAVGHLALGYLSGKASSKLLDVDCNIPFLFLCSALPDLDVVLHRVGLMHRGPAHSLVLFCLVFIPIFVVLKKKAVPYFVAMVQHSVLGDLPMGSVQLLWPLSSDMYGFKLFGTTSMISIVVEWTLFSGALLLLFRTRDLWILMEPHRSNLALSVPLGFVSFSLLLSFVYVSSVPMIIRYFYIPAALVVPHVAFFVLFALALFADLRDGTTRLMTRTRSNSSW